ncbi:aldo/keto reductase, partial [Brevibacterium sp.]|uniref:aldo/keto reductase n=1 Tax=Brevibacterium sp. TaxID=1701 RepID=UPI00264A29E2
MTQQIQIPGTDLSIFPINLGTNTFGWTADEATSHAVLDAFVAAGGNFLDTAESYPAWVPGNTGRESETIIGTWLAARGNRDKVVIATKVGDHPEHQTQAPAYIRTAIDASLQRL